MATPQGPEVAQEFEKSLHQVYGRFDSKPVGPNSQYRVSYDADHFLRPVRVLSKSLVTHRHANGLNREWEDHFFVVQQLAGQMRINSEDNTGLLRPNDMMLVDHYSAYEYFTARSAEVCLLAFQFDFVKQPKRMLEACGQRIDGSSGVGKILSMTLSELRDGAWSKSRQDREAMLDTVSILLTRAIDNIPSAPPEDGTCLLARAEQFVLSDLANPSLNPDTLADAIGVSRRQLYRLFAEWDTTPSNWIWSLRIREAHARMVAPDWAARSLTDIAFEVGFNDMAHFSRLYRAHFGMPPSENRRNGGLSAS